MYIHQSPLIPVLLDTEFFLATLLFRFIRKHEFHWQYKILFHIMRNVSIVSLLCELHNLKKIYYYNIL